MTEKLRQRQDPKKKIVEMAPDERFRLLFAQGHTVEQATIESGVEPDAVPSILASLERKNQGSKAGRVYAGEYLRRALGRLENAADIAEESGDTRSMVSALQALGSLALQALKLPSEVEPQKADELRVSLWKFKD
ncbi:hypothetical protein [Caudoviricetes sp.]|nr:hypothetical protein [Caudoviricetes sp.]